MKKIICSLTVMLLLMVLLPFSALATINISFYLKSNGVNITDNPTIINVRVYKDGLQIGYGSIYSNSASTTVNINNDEYIGQTVSYMTDAGHSGSFTVSSNMTVNLESRKLTMIMTDESNVAITNQSVTIVGNNMNTTWSPNSNGQIIRYLAAKSNYAYMWTGGQDSFSMTDNKTIYLVKSGSTGTMYNIFVRGTYGNYPVDNGGNYFYLYKYGDKNGTSTYINSTNTNATKIASGSYWVRDGYGIWSSEIKVTKDETFFIPYHKVTIHVAGAKPNIMETITVRIAGNTYYNSTSTRTDGNGDAVFYLQPGEYMYTLYNQSTTFTVENSDKTINVPTKTITYQFSCDDMTALSSQNIRIGSNSSSNNVTLSDDGKLVVTLREGQQSDLYINNLYSLQTVADADKTVNVKLYSVQFNTNKDNSSVYVSHRYNNQSYSTSMQFGQKYYLPEGEYTYYSYSSNYSSGSYNFTLNNNLEIGLIYYTVTINLKDVKGNAVNSQNVSLGGTSMTPDENGQAKFNVLPGTYYVYTDGIETKSITVTNADVSQTLTVPSTVKFKLNYHGDTNYTGSINLIQAGNYNSIYAQVINGEVEARIVAGEKYSISGARGYVTINEGSTIGIGVVNVTCEGLGVAFPTNTGESYATEVMIGSTIRLTAIPVKDDKFQKWDINGTSYSDPVLDFTVRDGQTTAHAVFTGTPALRVKSLKENATEISVRIEGNYIVLSEEAEGTANIYSADGKLMKSIGVCGDHIGIYDLPAGIYVMNLDSNLGIQTTRFVKE